MCGIAGIINQEGWSHRLQQSLESMHTALQHRGPDDEGLWLSRGGEAGLAHRRLAIIDLSAAGHQPMITPDDRYTIVFNGEIYNYRELRKTLEKEGVTFRTQTDTEVILRLYEQKGADCVKQLRGMFAFAIWDDLEKVCVLARDPLGIKPLYYHHQEESLVFASELRALCASQLFPRTINPQAVQGYFETGTVPEPLTLVKEASCLPAGHTLTWKAGTFTLAEYWRMHFPETDAIEGNPVALTREALLDSVQHHFVSDVPVGIFLSGGIDSTALLALAKLNHHENVSTCSIAVDDEAADESPIARRTAAHFGANYHEMRLDASTAQQLFADFLQRLDQPTIDGLNTFTVSALARQQGMKVVLSGLGGDELFGGYASFSIIPKMLRWHQALCFVPGAAALLDHGKPQHRRMADFVRSRGTVEDAFRALRGIFSQGEATKLTAWITGSEPAIFNLQSSTFSSPSSSFLPPPSSFASSPLDAISEMEITRYMRNQLLRDSDVMSMAHGLELRVPFVDRSLFEAITRIPAAQRLLPNKKLLIDAVPEVPDWVVNQKKRGFLFPYQKWLGGNWGEELARVTQGAPVPMPNWYQKWSVFVLRHSMKTLALS